MINCEHRTNARSTKNDQDSVFTKRFLLPVAISSLQRNEYKRIYLNSPYDPTYLFDLPLISSSLLTTTRRPLTAAETASTCNFMKAFTVHATNSIPVATGCIRYICYIRMCVLPPTCPINAPSLEMRVVRSRCERPTRPSPSSIFYFTPVRRPKSANKNSLRFLLFQ